MGKINVYLDSKLEQAVRSAHINVSAICQDALREAVQRPKLAADCKHAVVLRRPNGTYRCEVCTATVDIRTNTRKRTAS